MFKVDVGKIDVVKFSAIWGLQRTDELIEMTPFGDFFVKDEKGAYWLYSLTDGEVKDVSAEIQEYGLPPVEVALGDEWYQLDAQSVLAEEGWCLEACQCFSFREPVFRGGDYSLDNMMVEDIYAYSCRIHGFVSLNRA